MSTPPRVGALDGLRVLDLTLMLAGPYATMLLADQGAEVIKIEPPAGDQIRFMGPFRDDDRERAYGGYFQSVNRNKRSVAIDLKAEEGRQILLDLVRGSDVLVENFRAGVMDRLGLSYETLQAENPRLVYAAIRGFGDPRTGASPYVAWPAYDVVAQAMGGAMGITGPDRDTPMKIGPGVGDIFPAALCAFGVMAAVFRARATGAGQFLDVSMVDAVLALCERVVYQHTFAGHVPHPEGNRHPFLTPFGLVPCLDGHITLACPNDQFWGRLCDRMGRPELATDERFASAEQRNAHSDALYSALSEFTATRTKRELLGLLGGEVPFGPVYTVPEILADPHFAVREMIAEVDHPGCNAPVGIAGTPIRMAATPYGVQRRAPLLSEDADEILVQIGITPAQAADLRARRVLG